MDVRRGRKGVRRRGGEGSAASTLRGLSSAAATLTTFSQATWGRTIHLLQCAHPVGAEQIP